MVGAFSSHNGLPLNSLRRSCNVLLAAAVCSACGPIVPTSDSGTGGGAGGSGGSGGSGCPAPSGAGTTHGSSVSADETWTAEGSPHVLPYDTSIYAKLTLEPCAVVTLGADKTVTVSANGALVANGTAAQPVTIRNAQGATNWASIRLIGGSARLSYTRLENGGATLNIVPDLQGALDVRSGKSPVTAPDPVLFVQQVTISGSATNGVRLQSGGAFTADSTGLTITGSGVHAASIAPPLVGSLPPGTYTGNAKDSVLLTEEGIGWDVTVHDRGVPYVSASTNGFGVTSVFPASGLAVLTVEPGVVWKFKKGTGLLQLDPGSTPSRAVLVAKGTVDKPITFTSAEAVPAAGDWLGIWMGGDDARNALDHVRILYAGKLQGSSGSNSCQSLQAGTTSNGGALRVYHLPPTSLVTNTEFVSSATHAIDRGWRDDAKPSFLAGNTFTAIALCKESYPRDTSGACPTTPPCP